MGLMPKVTNQSKRILTRNMTLKWIALHKLFIIACYIKLGMLKETQLH